MKNPKKILIIIQRSNGDVLLSSTLVNELYRHYESPSIDLLVNDDTYSLAKLLPNINNIYQFSYKKKRENRFKQEKEIIFNIFKKYDLSINLTASDRSVFYAFLSAKKSISAIEKDFKKSWWKKYLLTDYYYFDTNTSCDFAGSVPSIPDNTASLFGDSIPIFKRFNILSSPKKAKTIHNDDNGDEWIRYVDANGKKRKKR